MFLEPLRGWTKEQRHTVLAAYLGWTLDAFDFFLLIFLVTDVASAFDTSVKAVTYAITLTLALRPVGAFIFGRLADRYGRKPVMMIDVMLYAGLGFATAFSPNFTVFLIIRALFGIAMGGEWGVGASLTMETIPAKSRGLVSGFLQAGYPSGLLLASAVYRAALSADRLARHVHGRPGAGAAGALHPPQCEGIAGLSSRPRQGRAEHLAVLKEHWRLALYAMLFMMAMNFFSHGTQDLYPTMLKVDHGLGHAWISSINFIAAGGAILGGLVFGALSQRIGRRRALILGALLALPVIPLWAFSANVCVHWARPALPCSSWCRAAGASCRRISTRFRRPRRAAPSRASSISSAISWPRTTPRCRRGLRSPMAAMARRWRWWPRRPRSSLPCSPSWAARQEISTWPTVAAHHHDA